MEQNDEERATFSFFGFGEKGGKAIYPCVVRLIFISDALLFYFELLSFCCIRLCETIHTSN
jgi:hypothetical protein